MHFMFARDVTRASDDVTPLRVGEAVRWTHLPPHSRFVVSIDAASVRQRTDRAAATP
jgi:hypothetical protein